MKIMEIRNVGPTLGQDSVSTSFRAGTVGVLLVLAFMAFYYKAPGLVADLALVLYVVIALGVLSGMNAVLTLPGIAGFILSIGMAVDANVLIFERIKEEAASGKRLRSAVQAGFKRAFGTILDSNITTLISAAVLFYLGTGAIKGYAVTLAVGILTSMFTAVFVTRVLLRPWLTTSTSGWRGPWRARWRSEFCKHWQKERADLRDRCSVVPCASPVARP